MKVLYMPWVPLFLIVAGLFFTFRTKLIQIHLLPESQRVVMEKPNAAATAKAADIGLKQKTDYWN